MSLTFINLKKEFTIVEDKDGNPYAIDHTKYPNVLEDDVSQEYEIHPIKKDRDQGEVLYESKVKMKREELTPKFVRIG